MSPERFSKDSRSLEDIFQVIQDYHQLDLNHFLKEITQEKGFSIPELSKRLQGKGYCISLESLYRYFSSTPQSNRFPPQNFLAVFADVLQLSERQTRLLSQFWRHYKLRKKHGCDRSGMI